MENGLIFESTAMKSIKCEKCGCVMQEYETDTCEGAKCPNCGWGWVTTRRDPLLEDQVIYEVKIVPNDSLSKKKLVTVSELFGINYLESSKMLKTGSGTFSGRADDIIKKLKKLKDNDIAFSVTPDFPYEIK